MVDVIRTAFLHGRCVVPAISRARVCRAIATVAIVTVSAGPAFAQALSFAPAFRFDQPWSQYAPQQQDKEAGTEQLPAQFRRQMVTYPTNEPPNTIIIDTGHTFLYLTLGNGMAMRYGIGVGRQGFTWSGVETIVRKSEWPDWIPPAQMVARQPYLPRWVGGGPGNPLGARALYLGNTEYRIHGTNDPSSIGKHVSSGCIRLQNADIIDLYNRVGIGTKVVVLASDPRRVSLDDAKPLVMQDAPCGRRRSRASLFPAETDRPAFIDRQTWRPKSLPPQIQAPRMADAATQHARPLFNQAGNNDLFWEVPE
jgi:lipoprotein-anchoring transpeptidase ErfK/SrfK